jgi:hypothetical protein
VSLLAAFLALIAQDWPEVSAEPACRPAETIQVTVAEIGRDPGRYVERCVRVSGLMYHGILHDDRNSLYLSRLNSIDRSGIRSSAVHHLWVAGPVRGTLHNETPVPATVVGRIDTCAQDSRRRFGPNRPGDIIVSSYHCYGANGQMIFPTEIVQGHREVERMAGEALRARYGNLSLMPQDWSVRPAMESVVQAFLAALRSGDRERAAAIHGIRPRSPSNFGEEGRRLLAYLFDDPASPFAPFRSTAPSQFVWFVPRIDDVERYQPGDLPAIACFCRTRDCSESWPISTIDIRHQPGRPYACTRVLARDWVPSGVELETDVQRTGPVEPMRTAAR